ncbi:MAG TPA: hypothetical protein VL461_12675 [Dictyobacter sp.]|jgi:hypothetical protein|nr:hypothetical protein [Dictyobacter sp.]
MVDEIKRLFKILISEGNINILNNYERLFGDGFGIVWDICSGDVIQCLLAPVNVLLCFKSGKGLCERVASLPF